VADEQDKALWDHLRLGYTEAPGLPALRKTVAEELYPGLGYENILRFLVPGL
jgi:hypothetical protein